MSTGAGTASPRSAIVLGASGSVGGALVRALLRSGAFGTVVTVGRASQAAQLAEAKGARVALREVLVPVMTPAQLQQATRDAVDALEGEVVGLSVLGIGAGTARLSIAQHRDVDVALNAAFARGLAASGKVRHLALMSAMGANAAASARGSGAAGTSRYNRVKGEAEAAVLASGIAVVSVFRPAMIIGSRHTPRWLEMLLPLFSWMTPEKYRSIRVEQIAAAMLAAACHTPPASAVYHYGEMLAMA